MNTCSSPENQTRFQTKMSKFYTRSDQNGKKTIPLGAAHSYMAHMREYSPHPSGLKAIWKWPIHKALHIRLSQTSYLQNHFSRHWILLQVKVFLSLFLPFLNKKKEAWLITCLIRLMKQALYKWKHHFLHSFQFRIRLWTEDCEQSKLHLTTAQLLNIYTYSQRFTVKCISIP